MGDHLIVLLLIRLRGVKVGERSDDYVRIFGRCGERQQIFAKLGVVILQKQVRFP